MDKKQFTSWGVSFGSLALVAGMVSYLGLTNKDTINKLNKSAPTQAAQNQNQDQQSPFQNGNDQSSVGPTDDNGMNSNLGETDGGSSFDDNKSTDDQGQSLFNNDNGQGESQFSGHGFGHHRGFDTTTGGT